MRVGRDGCMVRIGRFANVSRNLSSLSGFNGFRSAAIWSLIVIDNTESMNEVFLQEKPMNNAIKLSTDV